ncbi:MAG: UvrD-helicase domain-containing protein [Candidatus Hydrogenedentes bacterium]|nr:UvrD-helicase domain-containing protein [Candidatus Hydrogenedentota bacterium]
MSIPSPKSFDHLSLEYLNEAQRRAVTESDGPALVLAGAGTGKTRVIVERLAWLVGEKGVDPRRLLALTFTNRAAGEMRQRVAARLQMERLACWVGTFHSFALYVLRREIEHLGRSASFTVFDDADQFALMKRIVQDLPPNLPKVSPREALHWISLQKQNLSDPAQSAADDPEHAQTLQAAWTRYHTLLEGHNAVDFDDLLVLLVRLLAEHADVRGRYQYRYQYVHIDEYQDTNRAQYMIARWLTESHGNLFVVGDEDQSIYSWRGATIQNILDFERDFPKARVFRLEQNYRSTAPVLAAANAVVAHNQRRLGKTLWTAQEGGESVRFYQAKDGEDEARFVVEDIGKRDLAPRQVAVLFRTNGQARLMEEALRRKGLAYVVIGAVQFYGRKEVKDILSYLRLLVNPADDLSVRRIINVPARGIGAATAERFEEYTKQRNVSLFQVLRDVETDETLTPRSRTAVGAFVHLLDDLRLAARSSQVAPLVETLLAQTGYRAYVEHTDERDYQTRLEIVDEFVSACAQFDAQGKAGLDNFLQELALYSDVDAYDPDTPAVTLLTCHSAKGLEFDHVYLIGLEEGLLPHAGARDSDEELEEERRLCYVAMTRARKTLTLAAAQTRLIYGEPREAARSRFVGEIPPEQLVQVGQDAARRTAAPVSRPALGPLKMGTRVRHAAFGEGIVMFTAGTGAKLRARIRFQTGRTREFMVGKAPLEILEGKKR